MNIEKQFSFKIKGEKFTPIIRNYGNDCYKLTYIKGNKSVSYPLLNPSGQHQQLFKITKNTVKEFILISLIRGNL